MGSVGNQLPAQTFVSLQGVCHPVKGSSQPADLVSCGNLHPLCQITAGDTLCCFGQMVQGSRQSAGE